MVTWSGPDCSQDIYVLGCGFGEWDKFCPHFKGTKVAPAHVPPITNVSQRQESGLHIQSSEEVVPLCPVRVGASDPNPDLT